MAFQKLPGSGMWVPAPYVGGNAFNTAGLIDATGEKAAFCGPVFTGGGSKNITKVGIRFGAVTKAGGSALTLSLQDVLIASGSLIVPDETQDQTVAIANANAAFATNTYLHTAALSATRTVAPGEMLAVVLEYDGAGRLGSDSVILSGHTWNDGNNQYQLVCAEKSGAGPAWLNQPSRVPNVVFEFDDGTFGSMDGCWIATNLSNVLYAQNTGGADEYAMALSYPVPVKVDAFWSYVRSDANTGDFSIILYDGTSAMTNGTVTIDANSVNSPGQNGLLIRGFQNEITLAANHTYYLSMQPTTNNGVRLYYSDVNVNAHMQALGGGGGWNLTSRLDLGAWAAVTNTRRPMMGLRVSSVDDGVGGGGTTRVMIEG